MQVPSGFSTRDISADRSCSSVMCSSKFEVNMQSTVWSGRGIFLPSYSDTGKTRSPAYGLFGRSIAITSYPSRCRHSACCPVPAPISSTRGGRAGVAFGSHGRQASNSALRRQSIHSAGFTCFLFRAIAPPRAMPPVWPRRTPVTGRRLLLNILESS